MTWEREKRKLHHKHVIKASAFGREDERLKRSGRRNHSFSPTDQTITIFHGEEHILQQDVSRIILVDNPSHQDLPQLVVEVVAVEVVEVRHEVHDVGKILPDLRSVVIKDRGHDLHEWKGHRLDHLISQGLLRVGRKEQ